MRFTNDGLLQAVTAGYFYHTVSLSKGGVYKTVKHQQVTAFCPLSNDVLGRNPFCGSVTHVINLM